MKLLLSKSSSILRLFLSLGIFKYFYSNNLVSKTCLCQTIKSESCNDLNFRQLKEEDFTKCESYIAEKMKQSSVLVLNQNNKFEKEDLSFLKTILVNMQDINSKYIDYIEIEVERNISNKNPLIKKIDNDEKSKFNSINSDFLMNLIDESEKKVFVNDKIASTYEKLSEDVYKYKNDYFEILINEENNYKFKFNSPRCVNLSQGMILFFDMIDNIEKNNVCYNNTLGYLNSNVNNIGNGIKFNLKTNLKLKSDSKVDGEIIKKVTLNSNNSIKLIPSKDGLEINSLNSFSSLSNILLEILNIKNHIISNNVDFENI